MIEGLIKVITNRGASFIVKSESSELRRWNKSFLIVTHLCGLDNKLTPIQELYIALDSVDTFEMIAIDHQKP